MMNPLVVSDDQGGGISYCNLVSSKPFESVLVDIPAEKFCALHQWKSESLRCCTFLDYFRVRCLSYLKVKTRFQI
jgi:hypothetical protein